jgi:hypothetical protein
MQEEIARNQWQKEIEKIDVWKKQVMRGDGPKIHVWCDAKDK